MFEPRDVVGIDPGLLVGNPPYVGGKRFGELGLSDTGGQACGSEFLVGRGSASVRRWIDVHGRAELENALGR
ncbi:hypothetical protein ACQPW1_11315 [Nocardia sp. CA-128927]|uniref:hypothetical protein n=1 Tax=Nocardia sp. CA-128927 TaxID=3239975 RepID=UPI003D96629B